MAAPDDAALMSAGTQASRRKAGSSWTPTDLYGTADRHTHELALQSMNQRLQEWAGRAPGCRFTVLRRR
jgi:hypothetical protein